MMQMNKKKHMRRKMRWHKSTRFIIVILITVININGRINDIRILIKIRCKQNAKKDHIAF